MADASSNEELTAARAARRRAVDAAVVAAAGLERNLQRPQPETRPETVVAGNLQEPETVDDDLQEAETGATAVLLMLLLLPLQVWEPTPKDLNSHDIRMEPSSLMIPKIQMDPKSMLLMPLETCDATMDLCLLEKTPFLHHNSSIQTIFHGNL